MNSYVFGTVQGFSNETMIGFARPDEVGGEISFRYDDRVQVKAWAANFSEIIWEEADGRRIPRFADRILMEIGLDDKGRRRVLKWAFVVGSPMRISQLADASYRRDRDSLNLRGPVVRRV